MASVVKRGNKVIKPVDPTRIDYAFKNWYTEESLTKVFNFDTEIIRSNVILYAKWISVEPKLLLTFKFSNLVNPTMALALGDRKDIVGTIMEKPYTVTTLEQSAYVYLANVKIATFTTSLGATVKIGTVLQESGTTENDFTQDVIYTITSQDGLVTQTYRVKALTKSRYATIPDANFRAELQDILPSSFNGDKLDITSPKSKRLDTLDVDNFAIANLKGIEFFTSLTRLHCSNNDLSTLDISQNTSLIKLYCWSNQLLSLDVSKHTALRGLYCSSNQLTSLNISHNIALTKLDCNTNKLSALDLQKNTALIYLNCFTNELSTLDLLHNTILAELYCSNNELPRLNLSKNVALTKLNCNGNKLPTLDITKNTALTLLYCGGNKLPTLDITKNTALALLYCSDNELSTLDVAYNTALTWLQCNTNELSTLDLSKNIALTVLWCDDNPLISLDMTGMKSISDLRINAGVAGKNPLTVLKVNEVLKHHVKLKAVKTNRGDDVIISTYNDARDVQCSNYNPNTDKCNQYIVTFNLNGGTSVPVLKKQEVEKGNTVSKPTTNLTKAGFTFKGWYTSQTGGTKWDFAIMKISNNTTLYAQWIVNLAQYTVIFNLNGGTSVPVLKKQEVEEGNTVSKPTTNLTKAGFTFKGWYTSQTGGTKWIFATAKISTNTTIYAQWIKIEAKLLTFEFSGSANLAMALASEDRKAILGAIGTTPPYEVTTPEQSAYIYLANVKIAAFTTSLGATVKVGTALQKSGITENDFTQDVVYTVTSQDGLVVQTYTVKALTKSRYATIPDDNFRTKLKGIASSSFVGDKLDTKDLGVNFLNLAIGLQMASLKGIEFFTALDYLSCYGNRLTSLNLSKNIALTRLLCENNQLDTLDITGMRKINYLKINAGLFGTNYIAIFKINDAVKQNMDIKAVKTNLGTDVTISTYNDAGDVQCADYNPNTDTCN